MGVWTGIGVASSAAVAREVMLDAAKWTTINRLVECRYISAVAGAAVVGAVATVAEVKDKMLTGKRRSRA